MPELALHVNGRDAGLDQERAVGMSEIVRRHGPRQARLAGEPGNSALDVAGPHRRPGPSREEPQGERLTGSQGIAFEAGYMRPAHVERDNAAAKAYGGFAQC